MPTIIDSLIVTLGLDPSNFKAGQKDARADLGKTGDEAEKARKRHEAEAKKTAEAYKQIKGEVLALAAAMVAAVAGKEFLAHLIQSDAAAGRLANNLGMATDELSAWQGVAERFGSSAGDIDGAFRGITRILEEIKNTGGSAALTPLQRVGLDLDKFRDKATTGTERALMLADALKKLSPQDAQYFGQQAGMSEATVNLLMRGRGQLTGDLTRQREIGTATRESAAAAAEMSASFTEVSQRLTGIGRAMAQDFFPWLKKALDVISAFLDFARAHMPATEAAFAGLGLALGALSAMKFVGLVSQIAGVTGGLGASMTAAMGLLGVLGRLGLIGAAGAVGYGVGSLLSSGIDAGLSALNGAPSALGSSVYDAFHPGESARATAPTGTPRGIRNNNPGNLNFAGQRGASKESGPGGRFATFQSMPEGIAALADQLQLYASRGTDSVRAIISKYAPSGENNTEAYIKTIMSKLGVSADQHLNMADPNTLRTLIDGISGVENGRGKISLDQINAGMSLAQSRRAGGGSVSNRNSSEIHIGAMTVNTKATDAAGIARDIGPAMKNQAYALNADYGLN